MRRSLAVLICIACCAMAPRSARAATAMHCSIHAPTGTAKHSLEGMAKVSKGAAQTTALAGFAESARPDVVEGELEAEGGCVVYSFDLRVPGAHDITEVIVDAGTGKVLSRAHESAAQESAEKVKEGMGRGHK